jgi:hypothetical protein
MRWENWAAITVAMATVLTLQLAAGVHFDDPMAALLESIRVDAGSLEAARDPLIRSASLARL